MWLRLPLTGQLVVLACLNILLRSTISAEAEQTTVLSNISSTVVTKPVLSDQESLTPAKLQEIRATSQFYKELGSSSYSLILKENSNSTSTPTMSGLKKRMHVEKSSNVLLVSSSRYLAELNTKIGIFNNSEIEKTPSKLLHVSSTINMQETFPNAGKEENQTSNAVLVKKPSVSFTALATSIPKPEQSSINYLRSHPISSNLKQPMNITTAHEISLTSNIEKNTIISSAISTKIQLIQPFFSSTVINTENTAIMPVLANKSYTRTYQSVMSSTLISERPHIKTNSSVEGGEINKTVILEPSPTLMTKQNRSRIDLGPTSSLVNMTDIYKYMTDIKISSGGTQRTLSLLKRTEMNNSSKQQVSYETLFVHTNMSSAVEMELKTVISTTLYPASSKNKTEEVGKSSVVQSLGIKSSISIPRQGMSFSEMNGSSYIIPMPSRTIAPMNTTVSGILKKIETHISSSIINQTKILQPTDNSTMAGEIQESSIPTFSSTAHSSTETIKVFPSSIKIARKLKVNSAVYSSASTFYTEEVKITSSSEEIQPSSTELNADNTLDYETSVPSLPTVVQRKLNQQKFSITIKIISESFRNEYETDVRVFRMKSKEIEDIFDRLFGKFPEYWYTQVLRFFSGSLGCDLIIHTKSDESDPFSIEKIQTTLDEAKNTESGLGEFVVESIKEKETDVHEKETWGRRPIIVISILGGVCLVLLVMVISQCIQKRHYSHSLAESNEIREYSPNIQLKNNDDKMYKDEERVPMTTFNQTSTDIY